MLSHVLGVVVVVGILCSMGYYVVCLLGARSFANANKTQAQPLTPGVSILKPLDGSDVQAYDCLRSHCIQDYPDFEIIFGVSESNDAAVPIVERLIREFPERAIRLVICRKILGTNRKISNLIQMLPLARHDYLVVSDSDIWVPQDCLRRTVAALHDPRVGMVTCLYRGVSAGTLSSRLGALGTSTDFIPGVLAALQVESGIHFALGSTLAFQRRALEAIGGLEPLADYLADDFELGARISKAGFEVRLSTVVVEHYLPAYSFAGFMEHELRWARSTRNSRPWGYPGLILTFGLPWSLLGVIAMPGAAPWILLATAGALRLAVAFVVGWFILKDRQLPRDFWLIPFRDLLTVAIWIGGYTGCRVIWRGRQFVVEKRKLHPA